MSTTIGFDVYGTLIDTDGVVDSLRSLVYEDAEQFSHTWRSKQLEYSFRRGLMQNYVDFATCTEQALEYTCSFYKVTLTAVQKKTLLQQYAVLPPFDDVKESIVQLKKAGFRLFAFSNGKADAVEKLLIHAEIRDHFLGVVSVDDVKSFKPSPSTYCHFQRVAQCNGEEAWLVSSNPFDVTGAISAGMKGAWVRRSVEMIFDPWEIKPTLTVENLLEFFENMKNQF